MAGLVLEMVEGEAPGTTFDLDQPLEVGRNQSLGIVLEDPEVSRRHARLTPANGGVAVEDLGSRNGSYVNDQPVDGRRELRPGDRLRCGLTVFEVHSAQQAARGASGVVSVPPITRLDQGVLAPVSDRELPEPVPEPQAPGFLVPETEPSYVPAAGSGVVAPVASGGAPGKGSEEGDQYQRVAALRDPRVKPRTQIAAFALLALSAQAVILFFGVAS